MDHEAEGEVPNDGGKHRVRQSQQEELKEGAWPEPGQATPDTKRRSSSNQGRSHRKRRSQARRAQPMRGRAATPSRVMEPRHRGKHPTQNLQSKRITKKKTRKTIHGDRRHSIAQSQLWHKVRAHECACTKMLQVETLPWSNS